MAILVDRNTRLVCQGITGRHASFHAARCQEYGTTLVGGVVPGRGGEVHVGVPVFDTVHEARERSGANASMIFVPPAGCGDAILEAVDAGMELVVCITEGLPVLDMVRVRRAMAGTSCRLVGPNCPGVISPGQQVKVGIMPGFIHRPGRVGVVSRSGTLTYEAVAQLSALGVGQSTCVGIGGDPVAGTSFTQVLAMLQEDPDTDGVLLIGEIGGSMEEDAARWIRDNMTKPVAAFIAGATAPPGRRMGHAGAIISGGTGAYRDKVEALRHAGVALVESPASMGAVTARMLHG